MFSEMKEKASKAAVKATSRASKAADKAGSVLKYGMGATKAKFAATKQLGASLMENPGDFMKASSKAKLGPEEFDHPHAEVQTLGEVIKDMQQVAAHLDAKRAAAAEAAERRLARTGGTMDDWRRAKQEKVRVTVRQSQATAVQERVPDITTGDSQHHVGALQVDSRWSQDWIEDEDEDLQHTLLLSMTDVKLSTESSSNLEGMSELPQDGHGPRMAWFLSPSVGTWLLPLPVVERDLSSDGVQDQPEVEESPVYATRQREGDQSALDATAAKMPLLDSPTRKGAVRCGA